MIDWEDVTDVALIGPAGVIGLVIVLVLAFYACHNDAKCQQMHCPSGVPHLAEHGCFCLEEAKP